MEREIIGWRTAPEVGQPWAPRNLEIHYQDGLSIHVTGAGQHEIDMQPVNPTWSWLGHSLEGYYSCAGCGFLAEPVYAPEPKALPPLRRCAVTDDEVLAAVMRRFLTVQGEPVGAGYLNLGEYGRDRPHWELCVDDTIEVSAEEAEVLARIIKEG